MRKNATLKPAAARGVENQPQRPLKPAKMREKLTTYTPVGIQF